MNDIIAKLPKMLSGKELIEKLSTYPTYNDGVRNEEIATRLTSLSSLYDLYIPSNMSVEIYNKLYISLIHSLQKKNTKMAIKQRYENHKAIINKEYSGIMGGTDSFTIIGTSGIGKSTSISRAISLITEHRIIQIDNPYTKITPYLIVQCPYDCSVKGLILEILRKADEILNTSFYAKAISSRATIDTLIGCVSQVALNSIGIIIIDEIQNVVNNKNGINLIGVLMQLINNSGISICMVGTPECSTFFESAMQLARRSVGLYYDKLEYNLYFKNFCKAIFDYQYTTNKTEINEIIIEWLYEHSNGIISTVVSLIHDAQEIAILNGREFLDLTSLDEAYNNRLILLHKYINPPKVKLKKKPKINPIQKNAPIKDIEQDNSISLLVKESKINNIDIVDLMKQHFSIEEVSI